LLTKKVGLIEVRLTFLLTDRCRNLPNGYGLVPGWENTLRTWLFALQPLAGFLNARPNKTPRHGFAPLSGVSNYNRWQGFQPLTGFSG